MRVNGDVTVGVHGDRSSVWSGKVLTPSFRVQSASLRFHRRPIQLIAFSLQDRVRRSQLAAVVFQ